MLLVCFLIGNAIGVLAASLVFKGRIVGDLYLNDSDDDYATCGIEFRKGADSIAEQEYVLFKVHTRK